MELPQSRSFLPEGKKATHDFLSLYSHPTFQQHHQERRSSSSSPPGRNHEFAIEVIYGNNDYQNEYSQGKSSSPGSRKNIFPLGVEYAALIYGTQGLHPKTRDFLQPLETVGKKNPNGGTTVNPFVAEKQPPPMPPSSSSSSVEHVLPGGIGTYTISHIPNFSQLVPKPESPIFSTVRAGSVEINSEVNKAASNSNSYSGGSFTLWEEHAIKEKAAKVKDNTVEGRILRESAEKLGQWSTELHVPFIHRHSFNLPQNSKKSSQKHRSFMDMMKPGKSFQDDEEEDEEEFTLKDGGTSRRVTLSVTSTSHLNSPNDCQLLSSRFQILRDLIPQTDQKRDKASFLLEVIEYIRFLQEKVDKYDTSSQLWNHDSTKKNGHGVGETVIDQSRAAKDGSTAGGNFAGKLNENIVVTPSVIPNIQLPVESDRSMGAVACKPISLQPNISNAVGKTCGLPQAPQRLIFDEENMALQPPPSQLWQNRMCTSTTKCPTINNMKEGGEEMKIEGGTISISSAYSHGLLNNLTQALESSGVDLSQASISVQIVLGKQAISRMPTTTSRPMGEDDPTLSSRLPVRSRVGSSGEDSGQAHKRLKTENS
ncbi:hypothetical protein GIB67_001780 [Kingdonia uniflora]|uniref:BHLH domain-containing protein n=1 Tax=Kingdonia uniflora TaxID=39325 RepID=A0A7J7LBX5_9MAGN|nr:hypothetical protein GIB67_001780 [Kingdonia uniflora]